MLKFVGHRQSTIVNLIYYRFSEQTTMILDQVLMKSLQRLAWDPWSCEYSHKRMEGGILRSIKMEIDETIKGRRSIRRYQNRDIPDSVIKELLGFSNPCTFFHERSTLVFYCGQGK